MKGTFFNYAKLDLNVILALAYNWLLRLPVTSAAIFCGISQQTACNYYSYFENLVADKVAGIDQKIGWIGVIVEIDESKFGSRKNYRGHRVEGV